MVGCPFWSLHLHSIGHQPETSIMSTSCKRWNICQIRKKRQNSWAKNFLAAARNFFILFYCFFFSEKITSLWSSRARSSQAHKKTQLPNKKETGRGSGISCFLVGTFSLKSNRCVIRHSVPPSLAHFPWTFVCQIPFKIHHSISVGRKTETAHQSTWEKRKFGYVYALIFDWISYTFLGEVRNSGKKLVSWPSLKFLFFGFFFCSNGAVCALVHSAGSSHPPCFSAINSWIETKIVRER